MSVQSSTEAIQAYKSFRNHIHSVQRDAEKEFGKKYSIIFDLGGMKLNAKNISICGELIIIAGFLDVCKYEFAQHYSSLIYTIFVIQDEVSSEIEIMNESIH